MLYAGFVITLYTLTPAAVANGSPGPEAASGSVDTNLHRQPCMQQAGDEPAASLQQSAH